MAVGVSYFMRCSRPLRRRRLKPARPYMERLISLKWWMFLRPDRCSIGISVRPGRQLGLDTGACPRLSMETLTLTSTNAASAEKRHAKEACRSAKSPVTPVRATYLTALKTARR